MVHVQDGVNRGGMEEIRQEISVRAAEEGGSLTDSRTGLPLKTPDRQLLVGDNSVIEVRKRFASPTSSEDDQCTPLLDEKRRLVSRTLFSAGECVFPKSGLPVQRCLFGPPCEIENKRTLESYQQQVAEEYEQFSKKYIEVEELK